MLSDEAQSVYANDNNEFPVSSNIPVSAKVQELGGEIIFDELELTQIAENRSTVIQILNQINFDG